MSKAFPVLLLFISINVFGQISPTDEAQPIVMEGKKLYRSEMASWHGTDIFLESYPNTENVGGYFSYTEDEISTCVFYSKGEKPKVLGTISFDRTYNLKTVKTNYTERDFTEKENDLYIIRSIAVSEASTDTLFKSYENTSFNFIPLIYGNLKQVYVLTAPRILGVVIFGNDYLLTFDENNNLKKKQRLHKNLIAINYGGTTEEGNAEQTYHSHSPESGDFITATDICTLMLYAKTAKWKTHYVISEKYMSSWNCETNQLGVVTMEVLRKIYKDKGY